MKIVYKKYCFPHIKHGYITTPDIIIWYIWLAFDILAISYQIVAVSTINLILMNLECKICVGEICFIMLITQDEVSHLHNSPYSITLPTFGQLICINFLQEIMCGISWKLLSLHQSVLQKIILYKMWTIINSVCARTKKIYFTYHFPLFYDRQWIWRRICSAQLDYLK